MAANDQIDPQELREQTRYLDEMALSWKNLLNMKAQARAMQKEEVNLAKAFNALTVDQIRKVDEYNRKLQEIEDTKAFALEQEKDILKNMEEQADLAGKRDRASKQRLIDLKNEAKEKKLGLANAKEELAVFEQQKAKLQQSTAVQLKSRQQDAAKARQQHEAERKLIKDINKERGIGARIADIFRTKEERQRQIDIARAKAGGGANLPPGGGGRGGAGGAAGGGSAAGGAAGGGSGGRGGKGIVGALIGAAGLAGLAAVVGGIVSKFSALGSVLKGVGSALGKNLATPLKEASSILSGGIGGGFGIGGGAVSGAGATSILGGLQDIVSTIPFIGPALGAVVGIFKTLADAVLGIDQGITNYARNLGISKEQATAVKAQFVEIRNTTDSIVVNETRLMESQVELTKSLGIRSQFSKDILENNVKLKEIAGLELQTRSAIVQQSIIQGKSADKVTKGILAQSKAFEFQTGIAFDFRETLSSATKQAGVLGLMFSKYPEKLTKSLLTVKAMGFEMKQLDDIASSFLDFESSISKEMEAQVLTGKQLNLTTAREAALNNDMVTLAREINSQVGSTNDFLNMNRIQQEAIASSVGMTRDGLADTLKQQDYYRKLGATNLKQATAELEALKKKGKTQAEISAMIGEDAYNYITQTSTAERLTELMNRIKTLFVEFVQKSGILDFITNPQKIQGFVTGLINRLAGAVEIIGSIISGVLKLIGNVVGFFGGDKAKWSNLANKVSTGTSEFAGGMRSTAAQVNSIAVDGGQPATVSGTANNYGGNTQSISATTQASQKAATTQQATTTTATAQSQPFTIMVQPAPMNIDGQKFADIILKASRTSYTLVP